MRKTLYHFSSVFAVRDSVRNISGILGRIPDAYAIRNADLRE